MGVHGLLASCTTSIARAWDLTTKVLRGSHEIMAVESLAEAQRRIAELQENVSSLLIRVKLLEEENLRLLSSSDARGDIPTDRETAVQERWDAGTLGEMDCHGADTPMNGRASRKQRRKQAAGDMSHHGRRHVALKLMYIGSNFHGFASQPGSLRTVESDLFAALEHTKLLIGDRAEANYSRCGRTDRGVSASGQVIALKLRCKRKEQQETEDEVGQSEDRVAAARASRDREGDFAASADDEEVDYVGVLNRALSEDIRVLGWCPVPDSFNARFSCLHREYKYFFFEDGLDTERMRQACQRFLGEHDFRNFCKMDVANIHSFVRHIMEIDILPAARNAPPATGMWVLRLKGNAFLWHQVRCIASVLFMVGSGKEPVSIIDDLLDVQKTPRKPQYVMASEHPLLLHTGAFQGLSFKCSLDAARQLHLHMSSLLTTTLISAQLLREVVADLPFPAEMSSRSKHIPLMLRPTEPTYEERQRKVSQPHVLHHAAS